MCGSVLRAFFILVVAIAPACGSGKHFSLPRSGWAGRFAGNIDANGFGNPRLDLGSKESPGFDLEGFDLPGLEDEIEIVPLPGYEAEVETTWRNSQSGGSQTEQFRDEETGDIVKVFRSPKVEERHVLALVGMIAYMREQEPRIVPARFVRTSRGEPGIRVPGIDGVSAEYAIDRLNPGDILTDPEALRIHREHFRLMKAIDRMTGGLSDRRMTFDGTTGGYSNSRVTSEGEVVVVDPIDIDAVRLWMENDYGPPAEKGAYDSGRDWSGPREGPEQRARERIVGLAKRLGMPETLSDESAE